MLTYNSGGVWRNKRICDLIFAGSHDAGITGGNRLARTQRVGIHGQAVCGARFFDVRIAFFNPVVGKATHKSFHAAETIKFETQGGALEYGKKGKTITTLLPGAGTEGESLKQIVTQAKTFVTNTATSEFIILKFSKSDNLRDMGNFIDKILETAQYDGVGELNTAKLGDVAGKVICVYEDTTGMSNITTRPDRPGTTPRFKCVNLSKGNATYEDGFNGLQWYGKGGLSSSVSGDTEKIDLNLAEQTRLMDEAKRIVGDTKVLGIIYATATGGARSIKERDKKLWKGSAKSSLLNLCRSHAEVRVPINIGVDMHASMSTVKTFYPNVIMMDFVDERRCGEVYALNIESPQPWESTSEAMKRGRVRSRIVVETV